MNSTQVSIPTLVVIKELGEITRFQFSYEDVSTTFSINSDYKFVDCCDGFKNRGPNCIFSINGIHETLMVDLEVNAFSSRPNIIRLHATCSYPTDDGVIRCRHCCECCDEDYDGPDTWYMLTVVYDMDNHCVIDGEAEHSYHESISRVKNCNSRI